MTEPLTPMSHEDLSELVAAYALDAVEADERRLIEDHLLVCPRCRGELAEHREVAALLAHTGAPAPDGLWDRISAAIDDPPPAVPVPDALPLRARSDRVDRTDQTPDDELAARRRRRDARIVRAAGVVAAAAVIAVFGVVFVRQDQRIDDLRAQVRQGVDQGGLRDPDATVVDLVASDGDVRVQAYLDDEGRGSLLAHDLPALAADETYQLWGVVGEGDPISLGVLGRDPTSFDFHVTGDVLALAISAEDAPGVVVSRRPPVVVGELA